jgi:hypothetical protein
MSEMKLCQGPICHEHKTKDRIRGSKGDKHYETRKRSSFYYHNEFCSLMCQDDWFRLNGKRAVDHYGRTHEPKRTGCDAAWYKDYKWERNGNNSHYFANDLLGQRIPITEQQYQDKNLTTPPTTTQR